MRAMLDGAAEYEVIVPGMGSDHCAGLVRQSLQRLDGVLEVRTNIASHLVSVRVRNGDVERSSCDRRSKMLVTRWP